MPSFSVRKLERDEIDTFCTKCKEWGVSKNKVIAAMMRSIDYDPLTDCLRASANLPSVRLDPQ